MVHIPLSDMLRSILLTLFIGVVQAHTTFSTLYVDGVSQGDGVGIRMNRQPSNTSFPVQPLTNKDMACGYEGESGISRVYSTKENSLLTLEFRDRANASSWALDPGHKGPCAVYMKKVESAVASNNAAGDGWFKIWESTYDEGAKKWGTQKMIDNNGHISVNIPKGIEGGYYLVRSEILSLHAAHDKPPNPQFFVGCAQIYHASSGTAKPPTVAIGEGSYNLNMPGVTYNIYATPLALPYPMHGPPVYNGDTKTKEKRLPDAEEKKDGGQTEGLKPAGCILERDNWCAFEVPDYKTEKGCWDSSQKCWDQSRACWNMVTPIDWTPCQVWDIKCHGIVDNCRSRKWVGPPNKGKVITPPPRPLVGSKDVFH